jgi:hypothetical protein
MFYHHIYFKYISSWLNGLAPTDLAPNIYLLAWRKNNTEWDDLQNGNWMRGLWRMSTADQLAEFVLLWDRLLQVQLTDSPDQIRWRWAADGKYSSKSAYEFQFKGTYCTFNNRALWRAKAEEKHRLFAWLLVQNKILTADKLQVRNWPSDPICRLCDQELETAQHLCLHCVYAQELWHLVSGWTNGRVQVPSRSADLEGWWNAAVSGKPKAEARTIAAMLIYTAWNLWKE